VPLKLNNFSVQKGYQHSDWWFYLVVCWQLWPKPLAVQSQ